MVKSTSKPVGRTIAGLCTLAILIFGVSSWAWWHKVSNDPKRAFWGMLQTSLSTGSITKHVTQPNSNGRLDQVTRLSLGGQNLAHAVTTLTQQGSSGTTKVITESLGTKDTDYVRYLNIDTKQKGRKGQPLDFSRVLNVWGKTDVASSDLSGGAQFLDGTILGVVPFAPLNSSQRQKVLDTMHATDLYQTDYSKAVSQIKNGRSVFVYQVTVKASAYIRMLKTFAHELGLKHLEQLEPASYANSPPEKLEFTVDKLSHQLVSVTYPAAKRQEIYSGYGLNVPVTLPTNAISVLELQNRLQSLQ